MQIPGKLLMTLAIAAYAFVPPAVDLITDTHVFHPDWPPHARMHTVWLLGVTTGVGLLALSLLWRSGPGRAHYLHLAGVLSGIVFAAFFLSAATVSLYGGALTDASGGMEPGPFGLDGNLFTFGGASIVLMLGWILCATSRPPSSVSSR